MIDLLSPVGDFDCLKAAVQNGANSVYFGANLFSARAFASNFYLDELKNAITKGFKKATAAWGEKLPQLCQDTYDAAMKKMDDWKNGVTTAKDYADYLS